MKKKTDLEKSPQKKKGLEKPSNQRGLEKSSGRKGLEKPMKKPSCNDGDGLEKPGTIKDKVKAAAEEAEGDADQGAAILHGSLSKLDKSKGTRPWKRPMPNLARRRKELLLANGSWKRKASSFSKPPGGFLWEKLSLRMITGKPNSKCLPGTPQKSWRCISSLGRWSGESAPTLLVPLNTKIPRIGTKQSTQPDRRNGRVVLSLSLRMRTWKSSWSSSALTAIPCLWMKALEKVVPRALEKARGPLEKAEEAGAEPSRRRRTRMSLIPMRSLPRLAGLPGIWCLQRCQTWKKLWKKQVPSWPKQARPQPMIWARSLEKLCRRSRPCWLESQSCKMTQWRGSWWRWLKWSRLPRMKLRSCWLWGVPPPPPKPSDLGKGPSGGSRGLGKGKLDQGSWKMPLATESTQLVLEKATLRGQTTWATHWLYMEKLHAHLVFMQRTICCFPAVCGPWQPDL